MAHKVIRPFILEVFFHRCAVSDSMTSLGGGEASSVGTTESEGEATFQPAFNLKLN